MTDRPGDAYLVRHQDWARGMFGARGGEPLFELAPELVAAIILENDRPETMALQHTFPWSSGKLIIAAAIGNNGTAQIINPANSGIIVVVQGAKQVARITAGSTEITLDPALIGAGQAPNISLDSRAKVVAAQPVVASLNAISNASGVSGVRIETIDQGTIAQDAVSVILPARPVVLTPGHRIGIFNNTVNEQGIFYFWGYERPLESTELVNR